MDPAAVTARNLMGTFVSVSVMRHGREDQGKGEEISPRSDYNKVEIYKRAARNFNGDYRTMLYVYTAARRQECRNRRCPLSNKAAFGFSVETLLRLLYTQTVSLISKTTDD